ncbi:transposase [Xanthomonas campestris pv. raphani]|uniref:transposase n=1 Tax=Xanthomonas campestris TaxID=339 RepID=UPI002B22A0DC|nr:transposase [Xanthomonas campestris]MEA9905213.1 transposase [Xanthomonas campestris pv. raphani]
MPRQPRLELPGVPMHVVQRGVNRCAIFLDDEDRHHYCLLLRMACERFAVRVHAFVPMDNHVHLLVSADKAGAVSSAMRLSGQSYVQAFNVRHRRSGTLWQGRFKSCLVQTERYVLTVLRYIELNLVRAHMVALPTEYHWPSVHTHLGGGREKPAHHVARGVSASWLRCSRAGVYLCKWLHAGLAREDEESIRLHLMQERALGDSRFQAMVELALGRPTTCRPRGRPAGEIQVG